MDEIMFPASNENSGFRRAAWSPPPEPMILGNGEVHVWRASLDWPAWRVPYLQRTLAPEELRRAERFVSPKDRRRYIVARGLLRDILGRYLNMLPSQFRFTDNGYGKPRLAGELGGETLRFNVSHSHGLALYAVTRARSVGIDIERIRPRLALEDVAERFFSPREVAAFRALPVGRRPEAFFRCWTRKEAYLKAKGTGLTIPLNGFDVPLAPEKPDAPLHVEGEPREGLRWSLRALFIDRDYAAALAVEGHDWRLRYWQWMVRSIDMR